MFDIPTSSPHDMKNTHCAHWFFPHSSQYFEQSYLTIGVQLRTPTVLRFGKAHLTTSTAHQRLGTSRRLPGSPLLFRLPDPATATGSDPLGTSHSESNRFLRVVSQGACFFGEAIWNHRKAWGGSTVVNLYQDHLPMGWKKRSVFQYLKTKLIVQGSQFAVECHQFLSPKWLYTPMPKIALVDCRLMPKGCWGVQCYMIYTMYNIKTY